MMKLIKEHVEILSEERHIEQVMNHGYLRYRVIYVTNIERTGYNLLLQKVSKKETITETSSLLFDKLEDAESYGKLTVKCDHEATVPGCVELKRIKIYPIGYQMLSDFGSFMIDYELIRDTVSEDIAFYYYDYDTFEYRTDIRMCLWFDNKVDPINYISSKCDNDNVETKIVKAFNADTYEYIDVSKLNASTKELKELQQLLEEYYEKQKQYQAFMEKLLNKSKTNEE